jgi:MtN3 and saliva related transmembrane protein
MQELFGYLAAATTTASFLPQVVKVWRSGSAKDVSFWMYVLFSAGVALWLIYGVQIHSLPVILANGLTLAQTLLILLVKVRSEAK